MTQAIRLRCKQAIEPTIVFLVLFGFNYWLFGMGNSLIAILLPLSFMRLRNDEFLESNMLKTTGTYLGLVILAYVATLHLVSCILLNFFCTFAIIYLFLDDFNPTNQLPLELTFILYQMIPTDAAGFPFRLLSVFLSCLITYLLIRLFTIRAKKSPISFLTQQGLEITVGLLRALSKEDWKTVEIQKHQLFEINKKISQYVYGSDESLFLKHADGQAYFPFIIVFQHINNIVTSFEKLGAISKKDCEYLDHLSLLFNGAAQGMEKKKIEDAFIIQLISFPHDNELSNPDLDDNVVYILNYLATTLSDLSCVKKQGIEERYHKKYRTWIRFKQNFTLRSFKMRFALRLSIAVCPCAAFAYYFQFPHAYWLPMSIFVVMLPFHETSMQKMGERMLGTAIGTAISVGLSYLFPGFLPQIMIMLIANSLTFVTSKYTFTAVYITCCSLSMNILMNGADSTLFLYRVIYTAAGILIAILASYFIFPTRNKDELRNLMGNLLEIDQMILQQVLHTAQGKQNARLDRDLVLTSYLISGKIQTQYQMAHQDPNLSYISTFLEINNQLMTDLSHIYTLIAIQPKERVDQPALEAMLAELQNSLQCTRKYLWKAPACAKEPQIQIRQVYDNQYINHKMQHCAQRVQTLYRVVEG